MGVNLAGIEIILNMKEKMEAMQEEFAKFLEELKKEFQGKESFFEEKKNSIVKFSSSKLTIFRDDQKQR